MKKTAEKGKKIVLGVLLVLACILMPQKMTNAAGNTVPTAVDNLTVSLRNKVNMAVTDNGYMRVAYDGSKVRVEYYDTQFNLQRKGSLDLELPIWGGFYAGQDAYYLAEAQNNTEQSDTKEVIRVIKYDKNWRRLGAASITGDPELFGGEVRYPFDYGCVEMAESGNNLYLVTGHEGYVDAGVGQGHQGYLMVQIDKTTLKGSIVDCNLGHSFAQYIKSDGAQLYVLEQSEGGRCTELSKYDTASMKKQSLSVLEYGGFRTDAWAIACYASVDDLAVSSSNVLSVGTSIDQSQYDNVTSDMPHNLYLTITPKNNFTEDAATVRWLTDFTGGGASFLGVKLTKINDNRFMLSWEETGKTQKITDNDPLSVSILHYVFLDGNGETVSQQFTAPAPISDCHPIVNGSKIVYSASSANTVAFYSIDAGSGAFQKKVYRIAGENAVWNLSNGVLTISGTGAIDIDKEVHYRYPVSSTARSYSYNSADNSWKDIREYVTKIVIEKDLFVVSDEIYSELTYQRKHATIAAIPGMKERTVLINGFSKSYAMTGWRLGYAAAPNLILKQMLKIHQYAIMCAPTTSQYAAVSALRNGDPDVEMMRESYDQRRRFLLNAFREMGIDCFEPLGAFYTFPNISRFGMTSEEFATKLLMEEKVAVVPGTAFGDCGEGFVRISYAYSLKSLKEALSRIERFVKRHDGKAE